MVAEMRLRGIEYGHVFNASGARGFVGEGYWFHRLTKPFGLRYEGSTFVAKTTTLMPRVGNMPMGAGSRPLDLFPECIVVKMRKGVVLNAVGLSGPGALVLIERWRQMPLQRFVVSFMSVAADAEARLHEFKAFATLLKPLLDDKPEVALQINLSCPNVGLDTSHLVHESQGILDAAAAHLGCPIMLKLNALVSAEAACEMASHDACDAVVVSNTIPWGQLPDMIDWAGLFGKGPSPLAKFGGGGLSGKPLLPIVRRWIKDVRLLGLKKPIIAGGGILEARDAGTMMGVGADAIELGSVSILRPWRVQGIIEFVRNKTETDELLATMESSRAAVERMEES
jgi:dihydroorotate dehydrogenase